MKSLTALLLSVCLALCGCVSATATHTANGATDSITVRGFLEDIGTGNYTNGSGMSLSVSAAQPDPEAAQAISGLTQLGLSALALASKAPTNSVPAVTNTVTK